MILKYSMEKKTIFVEGLFFDKPREGAPDFVRGRISVNTKKFFAFVADNQEYVSEHGYLNLDLLRSKDKGSLYLTLNTFKPQKKETVVHKETSVGYNGEVINLEDVPF